MQQLYAVDAARDAGCLVSYDPNLRLPLWPDADAVRTGMLLGLRKTHIFANAVGALATTTRDAIPALTDREQVHCFLDRYP